MLVALKEARAAALKRYFTGVPCRHGHVAPRFVSSRGCVECAARRQAAPRNVALAAAWRAKNAAARREYARRYRIANGVTYARHYYIANGEAIRARVAKWRATHPERARAAVKRWHVAHPEQLKVYARRGRQKHKARGAAHVRYRQAAKLRRTPAWADRAQIRAVYKESRSLSVTTGVPHHVDHVIPLRGARVSGLHVHENLQVLPAQVNDSKGNRFNV